MSGQVDRLQALLHRVQQNRAKPRPDGGAGEHAARERGAASGRPGPMAAASMPPPAAMAREIPTSVSPRPRLDAPPPVATLSAMSQEPLIIDPPVPQPGKPVAQVVSKHPPSVALSFGELLRRSLSLRPR